MKELFNLLVKHNITPNQFYLLSSMKEGVSPAIINIGTELRGLKLGNFVDNNNKITEEGNKIWNIINTPTISKSKKAAPRYSDKELLDLSTQYLALWPEGKLPSGKASRAPLTSIMAKFAWFFENHKYTRQDVLRATDHYLTEYEKANYLYCRTSEFFISKLSPDRKFRESELANVCNTIELGDDVDNTKHFSDKVV